MLSNSLLYVTRLCRRYRRVQARTALRRIQSLLGETPGVVDLPAEAENDETRNGP